MTSSLDHDLEVRRHGLTAFVAPTELPMSDAGGRWRARRGRSTATAIRLFPHQLRVYDFIEYSNVAQPTAT
jgi:hypothetical protein